MSQILSAIAVIGIDIGKNSFRVTVNCSNWASISAKRLWQNTWRGGRRPPSQGWKTFLRNHADGIASMDLFVVPTISFCSIPAESSCGWV
jgi:hypothetical protein